MEDIAMLVFYLPIIIFEALFDVRKVEREPASLAPPRASG
jgi:hypothetical protein